MEFAKVLKARNVVIALIILAVVALIFFTSRDKGPEYEFAVAKRGSIVQEVGVTGRVRPAEDANLAFEKSGRVAVVNVEVGDKVFSGQVLARLDASELTANLAKAESDLTAQRAKLVESQITLGNLYTSIVDILNDAYVKADDAVRIKTASLFTGSKSATYGLNFFTCNSESENKSTSGKLTSENELDNWRSELNAVSKSSSYGELESALVSGESYLQIFSDFLNNLGAALNADCASGSNLEPGRANVSTARANVQAAVTAISDKSQAIDSQKAAVSSVEATVKSYEAAVSAIEAQLANTVIYSPIRGVVTVVNIERGESVSANEEVISVISASNLEIEADVPEVDVAKIKVGDEARVTLDAYGANVIFEVTVSQIDPAEKIIEGVPTYRTKFQFKEKDERVKSGMTANIDVLAAQKENVIYVPQRAVVSSGGRNYVRVLEGKIPIEKDVVTGLRGSDGNVEIVSGLNEGEEFITFERTR